MKKSVAIFIAIIVIFSCGNNNKTLEEAKNVQSTIEQISTDTETIGNGYLMKAEINGKNWQSTSMLSAQTSGRISGDFEGQYIGLPYNDEYLVEGKKIVISEDEAADIYLKDGCSFLITNGEMKITKVGDGFAEGTFYFTTVCDITKKTLIVTDGFFRIQISKE